MSADNYLISIPAKGGAIALYLVSASDSNIKLDGPAHEFCKYIASNYAKQLQGTYDDEGALIKAVRALRSDSYQQIEYSTEYRHYPTPSGLRTVATDPVLAISADQVATSCKAVVDGIRSTMWTNIGLQKND
jgi:hypothetical protein